MPDESNKSLGDEQTRLTTKEISDAEETGASLGESNTIFGDGVSSAELRSDGLVEMDLATRYQVIKSLGKGGMGEVVLAMDLRLDRKVAIKRILGDAARSRTAVNRFLTEAKTIAALNHPNIIQIFDFGQTKDGPFLVMEYVEGQTLLERVTSHALSHDEAIEIVSQICDGLAKAHSSGIIHRDIKPANILLTTDGIPKLTDFGLAKVESAESGMTVTGTVLGTVDYMPPEQRRDALLTDARSDLWSLAATFYQLITGKTPKVIRLNDLPKSIQDVLGKALEDKKEDRYQTATELKKALRACKNKDNPLTNSATRLGSGECPACHTNNDSQLKFCRECGETLRCRCLQCQRDIAIWENACDQCGADQTELADKLRLELDQQRELAETKRSQYHFDEASRLAERILAIRDRRVSAHQNWADEFLKSLRQDQARYAEAASSNLSDAVKHRAAFDYASSLAAIEKTPQPFRTREMLELHLNLQAEQKEFTGLLKTIRERVHRRELDNLLPLVQRAVFLKGDRDDLVKLLSQLEQREKLRSESAIKAAEFKPSRPPLPPPESDSNYHQYLNRKRTWSDFDPDDQKAPCPQHPDAIISDCQRLVSSENFSNFFGRGQHSRLRAALMRLEKWAYFYQEYRGDFINLWNQSAAVLKNPEINANYFEHPTLKKKYPPPVPTATPPSNRTIQTTQNDLSESSAHLRPHGNLLQQGKEILSTGVQQIQAAFNTASAPASSPVEQPPFATAEPETNMVAIKSATSGPVVGLLLVLCFPVGLYLLATHPVWSIKQKLKYVAIWLICSLGFLVSFCALTGLLVSSLRPE